MTTRGEHRLTVTQALPETEQMVEWTITGNNGAIIQQTEAPLAAVRLALKESMTAEDVERAIDHLLFAGAVTARPSFAHDVPEDMTTVTFRLKRNG